MLWWITPKERDKVNAEFTRLEYLCSELRKDVDKLKAKKGGQKPCLKKSMR